MKVLLALVLLAAAVAVHAQPRSYSQAELDALLAPVALYPDPLLSQVLVAATYPQDVQEAAAWSRANAHLKGDEAVRAAEPMPWDASLKALLAHPELLARMAESPQWSADLGEAFLSQEPQVMDTVQALRRRAQASGFLQSDGYQSVQQDGSYLVVQPVYSHVVYVPWYNPLVVYGPWWWHSHRPVAWRPWRPRPAAIVSIHHHRPVVDWHRHRIHRPVRAQRPLQAPRQVHTQRHVRTPRQVHTQRPASIHNHARMAQPIIQGAQVVTPRFGVHENRPHVRREHRADTPRRSSAGQQRGEPRRFGAGGQRAPHRGQGKGRGRDK